jgi:murein DD-endopeptidase MepM/ murein hydrolase activator NlpD
VVEYVGVQGGYGKVVILRHQNRYTTLYGHLSGFASGLRKGNRVGQGDVIGFVGATGLASGPHLHYEFRVNDVHQNPLAMALPSAPPLAPPADRAVPHANRRPSCPHRPDSRIQPRPG